MNDRDKKRLNSALKMLNYIILNHKLIDREITYSYILSIIRDTLTNNPSCFKEVIAEMTEFSDSVSYIENFLGPEFPAYLEYFKKFRLLP